MKRYIFAGAALLATAGFALAQSADEPPAEGPAIEQPTGGPPPAAHGRPGGPGGPGMWGGPRDPHWRPHRKHHGMHDHGIMGMHPTKGAMFVFDDGRGGGKIVIKCADEDSTRSCAEAVQPMLNMMLQARQAKQ